MLIVDGREKRSKVDWRGGAPAGLCEADMELFLAPAGGDAVDEGDGCIRPRWGDGVDGEGIGHHSIGLVVRQ